MWEIFTWGNMTWREIFILSGKYKNVGIWLGRKYSMSVYLFNTIEEAEMLIPSSLYHLGVIMVNYPWSWSLVMINYY